MDNVVVRIKGLSKVYKLYDKPIDRLKESLNLSKKRYYQEYYALNDISFEVSKGEILGIIGTNGSGKSTLLKLITGVLTPTEGQLEINGSISALLELGTGFNPEYTGIENIYLYGTMLNKTKEQIDNEIDEILEFAGIGDFIYQPVKTYSSGMFSRLAFSVAINVKPDILIVDEILSVGDQRFQIKCMKKMKEMMSGGTTVLFVAHDINAIKRFCTKAVWLNKGEVVEYGDVDRVTDMYIDFLKLDNLDAKIEEVQAVTQDEEKLEPFKYIEDVIAEIKQVRLCNEQGIEVPEFKHEEVVTLQVIYDVHDETIQNAVLGMAIRTVDHEYMCGLNTLLDKVTIPWKKGRNKFCLRFTNGLLGIGGKYYMDVALFEETATVPIEYSTRVKEFTIISKYVGEGRYIIPHRWQLENNTTIG